MSKASKVSHFHSTTYSAHRGGVAHATLGRPMIPAATAPGTVGAMTPKFKPQAQCVSFASPSETMQQYANRVLGGSLAKLDGRMLMAGKMQASETIGALARKSVGNRNWANVTANEVFIAAFHQPMPAGMPVATCALTERASLDWYGVVHGTEDEPGTVGAMTPKFKAQAQCVPFISVFETMQEYANRVLGGNVSALTQRFLMWGGKGDNLDAAMDSVAGYAMKASQKAFGSNRYWTSMRAGAVFSAAFNQPVPSGMPIGTCALTERASLDWYATPQQDQTSFGSGGGKGYSLQKRGTVTGAEEEADPTGVGAMKSNAPSIGNRVVTLGCPPGTHDDGTGFFGENCVPDAQSNGPQLQEVKETIDWIATCNKQGGIYDPDSKYYDPKDPCFQCAKGMTYDWDLHDCVGTPVTPPPPQPATPPTPSKPQGCEPGYSLIQNPKSGESFCTQCVQEHNVLNWTTGDCTCESGFIWQDKKDPNNFKCVPKPVVEPPHPPAPKTNCGPGTHAEGEMCVANETKQVEPAAKEEDNTWKWVAGIAAAAVVVGGGTYLAMKKDKKGQKSALQAKLSSHSTQTDVS